MNKPTLIFATSNVNKLKEVKDLLPQYDVKSLKDICFTEEIEETGDTFYENAEIKADTIFAKFPHNVFAEDSGLVIQALDGEPGIYSARYAGTGNSEDNIQKVLDKLKGKEKRDAYFITVICLIFEGKKYFFEGKIDGEIIKHKKGDKGFGYDPIFQPKGYDLTFAEMGNDVKNKISHRALAMQKLIQFLSDKM